MILLEVALVYAGLAAAGLGLLVFVRPLPALRLPTRRMGLTLLLAGVALAGLGFALPAPERRVASTRTWLDEIVPVYQFSEHHEKVIAAPAERVFQAVRAVTASEIRLFRTLTWIRSPRRYAAGRESILNPAAEDPILDVALRSGFLLLHEDPSREIVFGTLVCCKPAPVHDAASFNALAGPGYAKAVMNFRLEDSGANRTRLTTETRVFATDASTRRRFAVYWRLIYPGSALIRRMWLDAIRRRAEAPPSS